MKGVVFTEFLEMVEDKFGEDMADDIIEAKPLPSNGVYTSVGTYEYTEMVQLVVNLSEESGIPVPNLLKIYGEHLFTRFVAGYSHFFEGVDSLFDFMQNLHGYIHAEVHKLYPEAELPHISCAFLKPNELQVNYRSERPFADFAEGLMTGAIAHFNEPITIKRSDIPDTNGRAATFILIKQEQ